MIFQMTSVTEVAISFIICYDFLQLNCFDTKQTLYVEAFLNSLIEVLPFHTLLFSPGITRLGFV